MLNAAWRHPGQDPLGGARGHFGHAQSRCKNADRLFMYIDGPVTGEREELQVYNLYEGA